MQGTREGDGATRRRRTSSSSTSRSRRRRSRRRRRGRPRRPSPGSTRSRSRGRAGISASSWPARRAAVTSWCGSRDAVVRARRRSSWGRSTSRSAGASAWRSSAPTARGRRRCSCRRCWAVSRSRSGERWIGPGVVVGEMDQARDAFSGGDSLLDAFIAATGLTVADARSLLAKFGLGAEHVHAARGTLSPGERTRAVLARFAAQGVNCLVLDEPTNHLDLPAIEQLEQALDAYDGTLLVVTHDRRLLESVALTRAVTAEARRSTSRWPTSAEPSAATAPGTLALPLVERPRHLVLVVRRRDVGGHADEVGSPGVAGGHVPGRLEELVGAQVRTRGVHRAVVPAALALADAGEEGVVVVRARARGARVRRWRRGARRRRGWWPSSDGGCGSRCLPWSVVGVRGRWPPAATRRRPAAPAPAGRLGRAWRRWPRPDPSASRARRTAPARVGAEDPLLLVQRAHRLRAAPSYTSWSCSFTWSMRCARRAASSVLFPSTSAASCVPDDVYAISARVAGVHARLLRLRVEIVDELLAARDVVVERLRRGRARRSTGSTARRLPRAAWPRSSSTKRSPARRRRARVSTATAAHARVRSPAQSAARSRTSDERHQVTLAGGRDARTKRAVGAAKSQVRGGFGSVHEVPVEPPPSRWALPDADDGRRPTRRSSAWAPTSPRDTPRRLPPGPVSRCDCRRAVRSDSVRSAGGRPNPRWIIPLDGLHREPIACAVRRDASRSGSTPRSKR